MNNTEESKSLAEYQRTVGRYEMLNDSYLLPDAHVVLRLDAHRQPNAHEVIPDQDYPFGALFSDALASTARLLMAQSPYRTRYALTHGDEISILLSHSEVAGLRRRGKVISNISSIASIHLSKLLGIDMIFDTKVAELPTEQHVIDYFMWQRRVALRNYCSRVSGLLLSEWGAADSDIADVRRKIGDGNVNLLQELGHETENIPDHFLRGLACWWQATDGKNQSKYQLNQSTSLPVEDKEYAQFVLAQINTPGYRIEEALKEVQYQETAINDDNTQLNKAVADESNTKAKRIDRSSNSSGAKRSGTTANWRISPVQRPPVKRRK